MQILHWDIDPALKREAEENYRTNTALDLASKDALTIMRELTFDGGAPTITVHDIEALFDFVERTFLKKTIAGVGVEVGAGPLVFSSILSKRPLVTKMYGIEICEPIIERLYPKFATDKTIGVAGSFDEMELPDHSVDFVFDFFSLHHSLHLPTTLKELRRVLKPGGFLLCFDKARPDHYTQKDLDELMDTVYEGKTITRRQNGEREYRLKDWKEALYGAGFSRVDYTYLAKTTSRNGLIKTLKESPLGFLLPHRTPNHKFVLANKPRVFTKLVNPFPKEISLLIAYAQ